MRVQQVLISYSFAIVSTISLRRRSGRIDSLLRSAVSQQMQDPLPAYGASAAASLEPGREWIVGKSKRERAQWSAVRHELMGKGWGRRGLANRHFNLLIFPFSFL